MTEDLIARALAGDEEAARRLHDRHYAAILRLAYFLVKDRQDAEDATQEAFVYAFRHLDRYDPQRAPFAAWLKVIVTSRCRDLQRRRRFRWLPLHVLGDSGREPEDKRAEHRPAVNLDLTRRQRAVWDALEQVPDKSRRALILRYFGGLTYREMAEAMGCPVGTAKSRVSYGHKVLSEILDEDELT